MTSFKHLTIENRQMIATMLSSGASFKAIGTALGKDCTTISKEVKAHITSSKVGCPGRAFNNCSHRFGCTKAKLCRNCDKRRSYNHCASCAACNNHCPDYEADICPLLSKAPYVCNGCKKIKSCTLEKKYYIPQKAQDAYELTLRESRSGLCLNEEEVKNLDALFSPLLMKQQSIHHICANHQDSVMVSESTIYRMIDYNLFEARNIDLPRKVRFKPRKKKKIFKVDKSCRIGRSYEDFKKFCASHPDSPVVEMDSVEGKKGGKVLLTIHFTKAECMLAFLRNANDSQSVIDAFERIYLEAGPDVFARLFPVILGDNGSEFSNPSAIEHDKQGNKRTSIFYCDPSAPFQKGSAERNHEFIRMFIPQGCSFDSFTQQDISLMMNHINSYGRKSLADKSPYEMMQFLYGENILKLLNCERIAPDEVTLNSSIFRR